MVGDANELELVALDAASDADMAREYSSRLLLQINGLLNVDLGEGEYIERDYLVEYFSDGSRVRAKHLADHIRHTVLDGLHFRPPPPLVFRKPISEQDKRLYSEFMNRWGQPDAFSYTGLYKIFELVRRNDKDLVESKRFRERLSLFTQTANCDTGLDTRHAVPKGSPPSNPLPITEAGVLIRELYQEFVGRRGW